MALYAVDQRFWTFHQRAMQAPDRNEFLLSDALADELKANPGDNILVRVPRDVRDPTESLHGQKDDPGRTIRGSMRESLSRDAMGEFSLRPQQGPVRAIFVNLQRFQRDLETGRPCQCRPDALHPEKHVRSRFTLDDVGIRSRETAWWNTPA